MGLWTEIVGVRKDLHLRGKWWHHLARGIAVFGALVVYFVAAGIVTKRAVGPTKSNTFSVTLLTQAISRQQPTSLADLDAMAGNLGRIAPDGDIMPLEQPNGAGGVRCTPQARYKANEIVSIDHAVYGAIADFPGQPDTELRHCVALPFYSSLTAKTIVTYLPDGTGSRKQTLKGFLAGLVVMMVFLIGYWNVYYRGLMPFYARYRRARRELRASRLTTR